MGSNGLNGCGIVVLLCVILVQLDTQFASAQLDSSWHKAKYSHKSREIDVDELRLIALMSDNSTQSANSFDAILDPMLVVRVPSTANHTKVNSFIQNCMINLGWAVEVDEFQDDTPNGKKSFQNIVATFNPNTPRRLVLACHYDSKYFPERRLPTKPLVGATDSAVPCAMMIDLATKLKSQLDKPSQSANLTLQFIFFDGEEAFGEWSDTDSLYGSRHLASKWEKTPYPKGQTHTNYLDGIDIFMLLDLIGTPNPTFYNFFNSTSRWHLSLSKIETTLRDEGFWNGDKSNKYFSDVKIDEDGGIEDDHVPFLKRGVDILHLIAVPFPTVWHQETDNKQALDRNTINNLNRILRVFVTGYLHLQPINAK